MLIKIRNIIRTHSLGRHVCKPITIQALKKAAYPCRSIKNLLDRLEPYKHQINFSAQAEKLLAGILEELENRTWVERNAQALTAHGKDISSTGLAGAEFDRI